MFLSLIMVFQFSVPVEVTIFLFVCFCYGLNGMLQMEVCHGLRLSYLIVYNFTSVRVSLCFVYLVSAKFLVFLMMDFARVTLRDQ